MVDRIDGPLLQVEDLSIAFGDRKVVRDVNFSLHAGRTLGIVGASGSGKSLSALAVMGLLPDQATVTSGKAWFRSGTLGRMDLLSISREVHRTLRGASIAMIFQEPMTALNPVYRCGQQVAEVLRTHTELSRSAIRDRVVDLFEQVELPEPAVLFDRYPHQLSGGQKQRVMIAMAMSCGPKLLIADEPTTALDVTVQRSIVQLLKRLQKEHGMAMLFITHDLGVVQEVADELMVMHDGNVVETGPAQQVIRTPQHPYTAGLIGCRPSLTRHPRRLATVQQFLAKDAEHLKEALISPAERIRHAHALTELTPLLEIRGLAKSYPREGGLLKRPQVTKVLQDIDFEVYPGETLGLVGGSGSGKTTIGRSILRLIEPTSGHVLYNGRELTALSTDEMRALRRELQIIFQDPYSSLNPRLSIGRAMLEVMQVHDLLDNDGARKSRIQALLERVGLEADHYDRYPHEFSGGQRQRVVIARTLVLEPKLIICDESVSALDVSVQAQVLNLLNDLKEEHGLTYLFISHDLAVVKYMCDRIIVLDKGRIAEVGSAEELMEHPQAGATQQLIASIPTDPSPDPF